MREKAKSYEGLLDRVGMDPKGARRDDVFSKEQLLTTARPVTHATCSGGTLLSTGTHSPVPCVQGGLLGRVSEIWPPSSISYDHLGVHTDHL